MAKPITGIDIGTGELKLVTYSQGKILSTASWDLPENLVQDGLIPSPDAMGQVLKTVCKEYKLRGGPCALSLPSSAAFFRRLTMPFMTVEQLKINLPYEFYDYINGERGDYVYDYAVLDTILDEEGSPKELDLLAAAASKSMMEEYRDMLRHAGFRLKVAVPEVYAYSSLIQAYEAQNPPESPQEYAFLDLGYGGMRLHFFHGRAYENTRGLENGTRLIDQAIASELYIDEHLAHSHRLTNHNDVLSLPMCRQVYTNAATEILRAINFYRYNNPASTLDRLYLCGTGAAIPPLEETLADMLNLEVGHISQLMPVCEDADRFAVAYGICLM